MNIDKTNEMIDKIKKCLISGYDLDIITQEEMNILWNYITNLVRERNNFKTALDESSEIVGESEEQLEDYKSRIDKAIEYIEKHTNHFVLGANKEVDEFDYISTSPKALLNILKGEDKK